MMKNNSRKFWLGLFTVVGGVCIFWVSNGVGQVPPGKLTRQDAPRSNLSRTNPPVAVPGTIKQTALQSEDTFPAAPAVPAFPVVSAADDPFATPFAASVHEFELPVREREAEITNALPGMETRLDESQIATQPVTQSPAPLTASPLSSADPFGSRQPMATVPMNALPEEKHFVMGNQPLVAAVTRSSPPPPPVSEAAGLPGASSLEGVQTPHLTLQKVLPEEVVINQPATIKTVVQNTGNSAAKNVTITDKVPQGTRLLSTIPDAVTTPDGELRWSVGNLEPNMQLIIEMKVLPLREGEIGSVASVNYTGEASGRIVVTRPMLKVVVNAPSEVKLGETAQVEVVISNPGTAAVTNIVVVNHVPEGLYHQTGRIIENNTGLSLKPRESKRLILPLVCTGPGNLENHVVVTADGDLMVEDKTMIRASAPELDLEIVGAKTRFLEQKSDYKLVVANKGNASAYNVALELALPQAVQFISTNQSGVYEPKTHTVHWALEELPPQEAGEITLLVMPMQKGEHSLQFIGTGENNLKAEAVQPISIDGIAAITFEIVGDSNLVELGKDVAYEIRVTNRGTRSAENVKVGATLAEGMSFVKAEGGRYQSNGGIVQFETIPQLNAKGEKVYRLSARCQAEGDHRIKVQIISDDLRLPITKEESTRVFR